MELIINRTKKEFEQEHLSVQALMHLLYPQKQQGIAIAIGDKIIPKQDWSTTALLDQDRVLIITATQGG